MKAKITTILLALLVALFPIATRDGIKVEPKVTQIEFFNKDEAPPLPPLMTLTFPDLPADKAKVVEGWKKDITEKIHELGKLSGNDSCIKLNKLIEDFHPRFREHGVKLYLIAWPRGQTAGTVWIEGKK